MVNCPLIKGQIVCHKYKRIEELRDKIVKEELRNERMKE